MCTVHAPHWATPQPYFVPVRPTCSRSTQRSGVLGSTSTTVDLPLRVKRAIDRPPSGHGAAGGGTGPRLWPSPTWGGRPHWERRRPVPLAPPHQTHPRHPGPPPPPPPPAQR